MAQWLLKSEPDDWPWAEQVAKGRGGAEWTGIHNFAAVRQSRLSVQPVTEAEWRIVSKMGGLS